MRMESFTTASGITVLNDAYNANPSSMAAAVDTLAAVRVSGKRVAVLGDMAELGSLTELAHFEIGERVARAGLDVLVTVGERASRIADGARADGMTTDSVRQCATVGEAAEVLDDVAECGDAVLVKASRVMCLEKLVEGLVNSRVR
jgi:UDP-N-acetylmuramoyl-tripeptide--D-alanyl-D-alanine ligase